MKLKHLDLNLLKVFEIIYQERNLTRASVALNITQPAVSNALRRLRQTLDNQLFISTQEGMIPTPEAEQLIGRVREALNLLNSALNDISKFDPRESDKAFRFSMNDFSEALILPNLLSHLRNEAPNMRVTSHYVSRDNAVRELSVGQLDFVIDTPLPGPHNLQFMPLIAEPYVCAMNHNFSSTIKRLTLASYLDAEHVQVSSRRHGYGHVDLALNKLGKKREIALRLQHYLIAQRVASESNLMWTVPRALAHQSDLEARKLPFEVEHMECQLYWHTSADQDPANIWMRQKLSEIIEALKLL